MQKSQDILRKIRQILTNTGARIQKLYDDQNERDLLHNLTSNWEYGKNFNPPKIEGTYEWFLNDERFYR